ncbi:MAG: 3-keto-disaccharide hydrolase [Phycisphaerales bacterium]
MKLFAASVVLSGLLTGVVLNGCETMHTRDCGDCVSDCERGDGWVDLFNGKDLSGWACEGDLSAWGVEDGELVTVKPGQGWWLRTDKMYRDFELKLDFWMPEGGNSGVGIRGSSNGDPAFTGFEVQILDTHGEEPKDYTCGSIYTAVTADLMAVRPAGQWNSYHIKVIGDRVEVVLNGIKVLGDEKLDDRGYFRSAENPLPLNARATTGYISLQDHGHPFRYRNIKIKDLSVDPEPDGMVALIDDELSGWFAEDDGEWTNEGGSLVGRGGPGHLFTKTEYEDFEMRALVKVNERGNSGMYFRVQPNPDPNNPWPNGYEAQVDQHDPKNFTGAVYNMAWPADHDKPITRDDAWFDYRVRVEGDWVRTWINGEAMVDAHLSEFDRGRLAVQGHHDGNVIEYRDIRVLELD